VNNRYTELFQITTNSAGNAGIVVCYDNVGLATPATPVSTVPMGGYIYAFTGSDFNPATGAATTMNVPLNTQFGNSGTAAACRPVGLAVSAYAVSSLTNL